MIEKRVYVEQPLMYTKFRRRKRAQGVQTKEGVIQIEASPESMKYAN
jgi:hypothetical protein